MTQAIVLMNESAGASQRAAEVRSELDATGLGYELRAVDPAQLRQSARRAIAEGAAMLVAAGGDGTVGAIAGEVIASTASLGILPVGTVNHFARDVGLPADLSAAARVLANGRVRAVDVAEVNGHFFLNNSSAGLYPRMVERREGQRRSGRSRWIAMGTALLTIVRRYPLLHVTLELPGGPVSARTPIVFAGNNRYQMDLLNFGRRTALDRGELCVYFPLARTRLALLRLLVLAIFGRLRQTRDFHEESVQRLRIETRKRTMRIALDGEVVRLRPPLEYRLHPGALRVMTP